MIRIVTMLIFIIFSSEARENPFFPVKGETDIPITSNQSTALEPLKRASITLPSTARTIESFTVKYKNLNGSVSEKTEILGNSVDWHLPLFLSQSYSDAPTTPHKKTRSNVKVKKSKYVKIASLKFITLYEDDKKMKIVTQDKMIRDFLLVKPHRIVCDFKRNIDIRSYEKDGIKDSLFTKVRVGNHKGYYRVVIELDGHYRYSVKKTKDAYTITLK